MAATVVRGPGGALQLPQRVRASPDTKRFLVHLWPENEVWGALKLSQRVQAKPGRQTCIFYLKMKSLAMADLEITPLIHLRPFYILPPLFLAAKSA